MRLSQSLPALLGILLANAWTPVAMAAEEPGPDIVPIAEANNPQPKELPTIRVVKEKLWGQYYPMVAMTFPNVPEFQCDAWCYESEVELVDAKPIEGGAIEMRHRDKKNPQALVITTIRPRPGSAEFEARVELDTKDHAGATLPAAAPGLNLCWQLRHAPGFASKPDPYPEFVKRCFIFTERGGTFLADTERTKIPVQAADHEYNNPPWVQSYVNAAQAVPVTPAKAWAGYSADRYLTPVIGAVSRDGKYLAALANDSAESMSQAWHDCAHNNSKWLPEGGPIEKQRWRLCVYAMENDPKALLERVASDFPKEKWAKALGNKPPARDGWTAVATRGGWVELGPKVTWVKNLPLGPFVRLKDNSLLGIGGSQVIVSRDDGATWETRPLFGGGQTLKVGEERSLIRTANGALILVFMNMADFNWGWNKEASLTEPGTRLPVWAIRSGDEGQTWIDAQMIYDGYCGDIHDMLQTRDGHVIAPVQVLMYNDGRHALFPRYSTDDGKTWQRSNLLDIGGRGNHDGLIEPTLAERQDGVVWMLCRTNLGKFWSALSDDHGEHWRVLVPTDIPASSAPGTFLRLKSGRLLLVWNRPTPEGSSEVPPEVKMPGDKQWSDVPCSNYRAELSVALSSDDGKTWSKPIVVARRSDAPRGSLAYSYVFEHQPGEIWITTMQGDLRLAVRETDLVKP